jgi:hypothetical protein
VRPCEILGFAVALGSPSAELGLFFARPCRLDAGMFPGQHGDRRGISSRSLVSKLVRALFALYGLPNRTPVPPAGELSGSDRATRCPTEELRDGL